MGYREKYTRERHARGDATLAASPDRSRVLARLASLAQIGELARRLSNFPKGFCLVSAIHGINHYPVDNAISFRNTHPLESVLSGR